MVTSLSLADISPQLYLLLYVKRARVKINTSETDIGGERPRRDALLTDAQQAETL